MVDACADETPNIPAAIIAVAAIILFIFIAPSIKSSYQD
jgi:uncharacterized protein YoxC